MLRNSSTPLSPPDSITATHFSAGFPTRAYRNYNTSKTAPPESCWEYANMSTSHPFFTHFTGYPSPLGSTTKSPSSHSSASMATPPSTLKNSSPPRPQHAHSAPPTATDFSPQGLKAAHWETEPSAPLLHDCGTPSLNTWGFHSRSIALKRASKRTF